jgi:hypothetical protein
MGDKKWGTVRAPAKTGEVLRMKVSYIEDLANHNDSESCTVEGNRDGEALTGGDAGRVLSREITWYRVPTLWTETEGNTESIDIARSMRALRGQRPCACIQTLRTGAGRSRV